ncbi:hypothetical protein Q9966_008136 [Columba livia]|nr:hypothetical protein Q9966_008136 [Columba livia]
MEKIKTLSDIGSIANRIIPRLQQLFGVDEHIFIYKPLIYCHFAHGVGEPRYFPVSDWEKLTRILTESLEHYNELHAAVNRVLSEDATEPTAHKIRLSATTERCCKTGQRKIAFPCRGLTPMSKQNNRKELTFVEDIAGLDPEPLLGKPDGVENLAEPTQPVTNVTQHHGALCFQGEKSRGLRLENCKDIPGEVVEPNYSHLFSGARVEEVMADVSHSRWEISRAEELDTILAALATAFERATAEKIRCQEEVNRTNKAIELANRLVKGLSTYTAGGPGLVDNVEEMIGAGFDPVLCMCCDPESEIPNGDGKARTKKFRFSCFQSREYLLYQTINQPTSELLPNLLEVIWKSPTSISHEDVHNRLTPARCHAPSALVKFDRKSALASGFADSANPDYEGYHKNVDEMLPPQSSVCYGLHPNVEIAFVIITADNVLHMLLELQFKYSCTGEGTSQAVEDKGELAISSEMEQLQTALFFDNLPDTWMRPAYPSTYSCSVPQLKEDPCVHSEPLMNSMAILASCVHN